MSNHRQGNARPQFALGRIYATPGALKLLERRQQGAYQFLARHERGDWGLVNPDDAAANEHAVGQQLRIISSYMVDAPEPGHEKDVLWIITEADRSATTLLLPGEY